MEKYSENSEIESIYVNCLPNRWKPVDKKLAEIKKWEASKNGTKSSSRLSK